MIPRSPLPVRLLPAAGLCLALLGCLRSPGPLVFHTLRPLAPAGAPGQPGQGMAVEIQAVRLPEVLQRSQLVTALGPNRLTFAPTDRWGNGLDADMQRVLAANLGRLLASDRVVAAPLGPRVHASHRVEVAVQRCDGSPGQSLHFEATWMISRPAAATALWVRRFALEVPVRGQDLQALVAAHEEALAALSREVAEGLRSVAQSPATAPAPAPAPDR